MGVEHWLGGGAGAGGRVSVVMADTEDMRSGQGNFTAFQFTGSICTGPGPGLGWGETTAAAAAAAPTAESESSAAVATAAAVGGVAGASLRAVGSLHVSGSSLIRSVTALPPPGVAVATALLSQPSDWSAGKVSVVTGSNSSSAAASASSVSASAAALSSAAVNVTASAPLIAFRMEASFFPCIPNSFEAAAATDDDDDAVNATTGNSTINNNGTTVGSSSNSTINSNSTSSTSNTTISSNTTTTLNTTTGWDGDDFYFAGCRDVPSQIHPKLLLIPDSVDAVLRVRLVGINSSLSSEAPLGLNYTGVWLSGADAEALLPNYSGAEAEAGGGVRGADEPSSVVLLLSLLDFVGDAGGGGGDEGELLGGRVGFDLVGGGLVSSWGAWWPDIHSVGPVLSGSFGDGGE